MLYYLLHTLSSVRQVVPPKGLRQGVAGRGEGLYGNSAIISPTIISEHPLICYKNPCQRGEDQGRFLKLKLCLKLLLVKW